MSSEVCTQIFPALWASSSEWFRAGISFPALTTLRPSCRYSSGHSLSTYHTGWTFASLYFFWMFMMSLMPSVVRVRKPEMTEKWNSSREGMCFFSSSERCSSRRSRSASGPVTGGRSRACHASERRPAKYAAEGPSNRLRTTPMVLLNALSSPLARKRIESASESSSETVFVSKASAASSVPWANRNRACGAARLASAARRSRKDRCTKESPLSSRRSTRIIGLVIFSCS
mmetsp:Transcript_94726/g.271741  ORF Transcript_94726/g.271741 Transcript_94726/m.271741 type:complete len:230 (+) Transcript_94726:700-1389(+)